MLLCPMCITEHLSRLQLICHLLANSTSLLISSCSSIMSSGFLALWQSLVSSGARTTQLTHSLCSGSRAMTIQLTQSLCSGRRAGTIKLSPRASAEKDVLGLHNSPRASAQPPAYGCAAQVQSVDSSDACNYTANWEAHMKGNQI